MDDHSTSRRYALDARVVPGVEYLHGVSAPVPLDELNL